MPFVSQKQRALCWYLWNKAQAENKTPSWDCPLWEAHTQNKNLPTRISTIKKRYKLTKEPKRKSRRN